MHPSEFLVSAQNEVDAATTTRERSSKNTIWNQNIPTYSNNNKRSSSSSSIKMNSLSPAKLLSFFLVIILSSSLPPTEGASVFHEAFGQVAEATNRAGDALEAAMESAAVAVEPRNEDDGLSEEAAAGATAYSCFPYVFNPGERMIRNSVSLALLLMTDLCAYPLRYNQAIGQD